MDWHTALQYALLALMGWGCGFLNTIGGGGSLVVLPVLVFMGLPGTVANGTNRLAVLFQTLFAVKGFRDKGVALPVPYAYYLSLASLAGGMIGVMVAVRIPDTTFNKTLAVVMLLALISILIKSPASSADGKERMDVSRRIWGIVIFLLLSLYGGFLQAGVGFLIIATLSHLHNMSLVKINYIKVFIAILYTTASIVVFAFYDKVVWSIGLTLAAGQALGGWQASRWSVDKGDKWIKLILTLTIVPMAIKLWFF